MEHAHFGTVKWYISATRGKLDLQCKGVPYKIFQTGDN